MPRRPIQWPFAGRADDSAHSAQPELTTRQARNVRNRDPVTGRVRGASRSGLLKWNPDAIGVGRVKALVSTAVDTRKTEFDFTAGQETTLWSASTPSKGSTLEGRVDQFGNVYALDGNAGIAKYNSAGVFLMKISLPVADDAHTVRALWIDGVKIYAAVSSGGDSTKSRIWAILQLPDNEYFILWTLEPGAFCESLRVFRGTQLYAALNYPVLRVSRVVVYEGLAIDPFEVKRIDRSLAFPINDMDLGEDGSIYCASGPVVASGVTRPGYKSDSDTSNVLHAPLVGWTVRDDPTIRVWSDFDSTEVDVDDVEGGELVTGAQVLRLRDNSGANRHLFAGSLYEVTESGPTYLERGTTGLPSLLFQNEGVILQSLVSLTNPSTGVELAEQQRTPIPAYAGSMWAMFLLIRPSMAPSGLPRAVFGIENEASTGSDHALYLNRAAGTVIPGAEVLDKVSYFATTDNTGDPGGSGTVPPHSRDFDFGDNTAGATPLANQAVGSGCLLVTILWDGQVEPNDTSKTRCLVRFNGRPIDRFEGLPFTTTKSFIFGAVSAALDADGANPLRRFNGELMKFLVVERLDRRALTEPKVLSFDIQESTSANTPQTDTQIARIEAEIAYKFGVGYILPGANLYPHVHFYGRSVSTDILLGPPAPTSGGFYEAHQVMLLQDGLVSKHDDQGTLKWAASSSYVTTEGGFGYGVRVRKLSGTTHVWCYGPKDGQTTGTGTVELRKIIDFGADYSELSADGAWTHNFSGSPEPGYAYPRMASDKFGNLYVPGYDIGAGTIRALHIFALDGSGGNAVQLTEFLLTAPADLAHAVALPPDDLTPDYRGELATELAEAVYIFTVAGAEPLDPSTSVWKIGLVSTTALATGNPREVTTIAIVEDDIRLVTAASNSIITGGTAAIDGTSQYVQAIRAGEDIVILDGTRYLAYKLRDGTLAALASTSAGEIPPRGRYMMFWRHRLVIALEGGRYAASRLGNIRDWNLNPGVNLAGVPLQTSTQAFTGTIVRAGEAEDSLVTMIPVVDDLAFFVGESKILRMTGDPQDGGNIHLVTDSMGGVFGDSWCKDSGGRVFMWGNKPPGLYFLPPVGVPESLSERSLEVSEFEAIDYSTHRIVLAWDPIEHGVRIFQVAWGTSVVVAHWFWEERTHRLVQVPPVWQDQINSADKQPTSVAYLAGDDSRAMLVGCADGYIRMFDPSALDDDGTAIDSHVLIEVTGGLPEKAAARLTEASIVLADDQGGAQVEVFSGETADDIGTILAARDLKPGRNAPFRVRAKGAHIWLRIRNARTGRWAWEEGSVNMEPAGRMRQFKT